MVTMPGQVQDTTIRTGIGKAIPGHNYIFADTKTQVIRIPIEVVLDHAIGIVTIITEVAHDTQVLHTEVITINLTMTLHIDHTSDHPHTVSHHTTSEIEACHAHVHHTNLHDESHLGHTCTPVDQNTNHITSRIPE